MPTPPGLRFYSKDIPGPGQEENGQEGEEREETERERKEREESKRGRERGRGVVAGGEGMGAYKS